MENCKYNNWNAAKNFCFIYAGGGKKNLKMISDLFFLFFSVALSSLVSVPSSAILVPAPLDMFKFSATKELFPEEKEVRGRALWRKQATA